MLVQFLLLQKLHLIKLVPLLYKFIKDSMSDWVHIRITIGNLNISVHHSWG